jgi:ABC-type multidrug transport system ATPase subunit
VFPEKCSKVARKVILCLPEWRAETRNKKLPQFVTYGGQRDEHYPTLTVKETLEFCSGGLFRAREKHLTSGTPMVHQTALDAARDSSTSDIIHQLGLEDCQNTVVGDAMLHGVSSGERKRVTTGEIAFGNKFVLMMDEISTGLDSAATFDIISTLTKALGKTVVISLLQPAPEVFELFDDVLLLNNGYVMYYGSRSEALDYFESLGFKCPASRDVADFLLDLSTEKQRQYEVGSFLTQASEFSDAFKCSSVICAW